MSRMSDIMEMVKQGYSVKEIKEVFELGKEIESEPEENQETPEENTEGGNPGADPDPEQKEDHPGSDPEEDYKTKYEELLKKYQQKNIRQDISDKNEKTIEEQASDILAEMIGG